MRVLGVRCTKDAIQWVLLEGNSRADAVVIDHEEVPAVPRSSSPAARPAQLLWAWKEVVETVTRTKPDRAAIKMNEAQSGGAARCELEGVVQAAFAGREVPIKRYKSASIRSAFGAANKDQVAALTSALPAVATSAKVRHEQILVALGEFPD